VVRTCTGSRAGAQPRRGVSGALEPAPRRTAVRSARTASPSSRRASSPRGSSWSTNTRHGGSQGARNTTRPPTPAPTPPSPTPPSQSVGGQGGTPGALIAQSSPPSPSLSSEAEGLEGDAGHSGGGREKRPPRGVRSRPSAGVDGSWSEFTSRPWRGD
jgi:hypothetical protein